MTEPSRFEWDGKPCRPFEEICKHCHRPLGDHNKGFCPTDDKDLLAPLELDGMAVADG